jgi:hypothetical protein
MEYNTELYDPLKLPPGPCIQLYTNVTTHIYPLRADKEKIQSFCEHYLNLNPRNPYCTFTAAGPWMLMQVCEYPKMSFADPDGPFAHRWFAQHELAFGIPVKCTYRDGASEFGMVYPFIFVDNPLSMEGGRQIYGWPKAGIDIVNTQPEFRPNGPQKVIRIELSPFVINKTQQDGPPAFVEIYQTRPFLSGRSGIAEIVTSVPRAVGGYLAGVSVFLNTIAIFGNVIAGYRLPNTGTALGNIAALGDDFQSLVKGVQQSYGYINSLITMLLGVATGRKDPLPPDGRPKLTIFTMKQVRDAVDTTSACYQAIVRSQMTVHDVKDGGLLFDALSGDPTGGIEITLNTTNEYMSALTELITERSTKGSEHRVRPFVPFWERIDLSYGLADSQSWCTRQTGWQHQSSAPPSTTGSVAVPVKGIAGKLEYQKRGSGGALAVAGDRNAPGTVLHTFMLRTDPGILQKLVDGYLNELSKPNRAAKQPVFRFEVKNKYPWIYVLLLTYDKMKIGRTGPYGDNVVAFAVMAEYLQLDANGAIMNREDAFIQLYTFVGTDWNFVTEYEVYGRLTFKSNLVSPEDAWLKESAPVRREVLSVSIPLFPAHPEVASERKGAVPTKVISIFSGPEAAHRSWSIEQEPEALESLKTFGLDDYLQVKGTVRTPKGIALKQVRNAIHGERADYQSLIAVPRTFELADKFGESQVRIRIYKRKGFPLLNKMGLAGNSGSDVHGTYEEFDAQCLSFTGTFIEHQGEEMWWRVADTGDVWRKGI